MPITIITTNKMLGTKAYVLIDTKTCLIGKPNCETSKLLKTILVIAVKPKPTINSTTPTIQNQKPNMVQGFLVNVLIRVKISKIAQTPAKTNKPINKPKET